MKYYDIYQNPEGKLEAVKQGWCWPGFFFTWIWAFYKRLYGLGVGLLFIVIIIFFLGFVGEEFLLFIGFVLPLLITIWIGAEGYKIYGKALEEKGYKYIRYVIAYNRQDAVSVFSKEI